MPQGSFTDDIERYEHCLIGRYISRYQNLGVILQGPAIRVIYVYPRAAEHSASTALYPHSLLDQSERPIEGRHFVAERSYLEHRPQPQAPLTASPCGLGTYTALVYFSETSAGLH